MKPSERIQEIYFKMRGNLPDDPVIGLDAIMQYLDEQYQIDERKRV